MPNVSIPVDVHLTIEVKIIESSATSQVPKVIVNNNYKYTLYNL